MQILESSKYNKKTKKHIRIKKAIHPKNEIIFDFMIYLPNDKSEVVESLLLVNPKTEVKRCNNTNSEII